MNVSDLCASLSQGEMEMIDPQLVIAIVGMLLGMSALGIGIFMSQSQPKQTPQDWKEFQVWCELEKDAPKMGEGFGRWLGSVVHRERSERIDAEFACESLQRLVSEQGSALIENEKNLQTQAESISSLLDSEHNLDTALWNAQEDLEILRRENETLIRNLAETSDKLRARSCDRPFGLLSEGFEYLAGQDRREVYTSDGGLRTETRFLSFRKSSWV